MTNEQRPLQILPYPQQAGDPETGWEEVYRATVVLIYRYIYARVGNQPDAGT